MRMRMSAYTVRVLVALELVVSSTYVTRKVSVGCEMAFFAVAVVVRRGFCWHQRLAVHLPAHPLACFCAQVARVPNLHLIDAVISAEEKQLLRKDGLDSCALR